MSTMSSAGVLESPVRTYLGLGVRFLAPRMRLKVHVTPLWKQKLH